MSRAAALVVLLLVATPGGTSAATQQEVEESLTCQCGCGLTVHSCNHLQCPSAEPIKKEIAQRLARGELKMAILGAFRQRYGEKVLSSPTFEGFNLLAWVVPFAAVLVGGLLVTVVVRRWARETAAVPPPPGPGAEGDEMRQRLARELADLDRES